MIEKKEAVRWLKAMILKRKNFIYVTCIFSVFSFFALFTINPDTEEMAMKYLHLTLDNLESSDQGIIETSKHVLLLQNRIGVGIVEKGSDSAIVELTYPYTDQPSELVELDYDKTHEIAITSMPPVDLQYSIKLTKLDSKRLGVYANYNEEYTTNTLKQSIPFLQPRISFVTGNRYAHQASIILTIFLGFSASILASFIVTAINEANTINDSDDCLKLVEPIKKKEKHPSKRRIS